MVCTGEDKNRFTEVPLYKEKASISYIKALERSSF